MGTVAATGFVLSGHQVLATDVDPAKVQALCAGIYGGNEEGLAERLKTALKAGNVRFRCCDGVDEDLGDVALVAVGTPSGEGYAPELSQVRAAICWVRERCDANLVVAMKSTVPPGTGRSFLQNEFYGTGIGYIANPEFLRAGRALADWDRPDRIVIGLNPATPAPWRLCAFYTATSRPRCWPLISPRRRRSSTLATPFSHPHILHERDCLYLRQRWGVRGRRE